MPSQLARIASLSLALALSATAALPDDLCTGYTDTVQFDPANGAACAALLPEVQSPSQADGSPKPLNVYEAKVGQFFNMYCHRDPMLGFAVDKDVRDTGPFVAYRDQDNAWVTEYHGTHAPVVIWYSPAMLDWLKANRPADAAAAPADAAPVPDGAIIVKEMFTPPASRCAGLDREKLIPQNGIAYMVRDAGASRTM